MLASVCFGAVVSCTHLVAQQPVNEPDESYALFEQPGRMVRLPHGNRLSLYCTGKGEPTVVMEAGFGGGAYSEWHQLQPRLTSTTRTCSYDRAGYGFSELGNDLPRDIRHDVTDLHSLLKAAKEHGPYLLVGHSDGGHIIGAFSDAYPKEVVGLIFLDAAVLLDKEQLAGPAEKPSPNLQKYYDGQLEKIRTCLRRAETATGPLTATPGDYCLDSEELAKLPPRMAYALAMIAARPDNWRAFLSEAEQHYLVDDPTWEASLLPHHWEKLPIQVFTASVAALDDAHSAALYGLTATDHEAIAAARAGRKRWEGLQARICELSKNCQVHLIPTADHEVQNAVPDEVAKSIRDLVFELREQHRQSR
jgi:pimeloyl-ACP methyl ester carboxylesterase